MQSTQHQPISLGHYGAFNPDSLAVITTAGRHTFGELVQSINALSEALRNMGVGMEVPTGVCAERNFWWIVGAASLFNIGGTYLPIDPTAPMSQTQHIMTDSGVSCVLVGEASSITVPTELRVTALNQGRSDAKQTGHIISNDQAAYLIYTSGSTGRPKGVIVTYGNLTNYLEMMRGQLEITSSDRYLQTASPIYSSSIRQVFLPLSVGATVVVAGRDTQLDLQKLIHLMMKEGVTVLDTVPSYLNQIIAAIWEAPRDWRDRLASSLRIVITTAEAMPMMTAKSLYSLFPNVRLVNCYGQTETAGTVSLYDVRPNEVDAIPIGRGFAPYRFYVLDQDLNPSTEGELYVSGLCVTRGYHKQPALTALRYLPDPFTTEAGSRMYRTGDFVKTRSDGELVFAGRSDSQVKVSGIRIELGEIEAALLCHPLVKEAAALVRASDEASLFAFVALKDGAPPVSAEDMRAHLAGHLNQQAMPRKILFLDHLPRMMSGKVDRQELLTTRMDDSSHYSTDASTTGELEDTVRKVWRDVLGVAGVSWDDDFFVLGGDSLQAIKMTWRLQKIISVPVPLASIFFQDPVFGAFVSAIQTELDEEEEEIDGLIDLRTERDGVR